MYQFHLIYIKPVTTDCYWKRKYCWTPPNNQNLENTPQPRYNTIAGIQKKKLIYLNNHVVPKQKKYRLYRKMTIYGHFSI